ncbi:F420-dependent glucose-6-phosphate dehydrogenase [Streptomyces tendae]
MALARVADRAGLDLVSVPDHPYRPELLDAWMALAVIAASTTRVRVFPNVANLPLRPPAVLARTAAGLDLLSGGRVELGLGAGSYWDAIAADGGPRRSPGEAVRATREAIDVIRALWSQGQGVRLPGESSGSTDATAGPAPAHPMGIWVGAIGPRMLRLTGATADGWLPSVPHVPPGRLAAGHRVVDEAAVAAGRAPSEVRRLYNLSPGPGGFPQGPLEAWPEQLAALTLEHGTSGFLLRPPAGPAPGVRGTSGTGDAGAGDGGTRTRAAYAETGRRLGRGTWSGRHPTGVRRARRPAADGAVDAETPVRVRPPRTRWVVGTVSPGGVQVWLGCRSGPLAPNSPRATLPGELTVRPTAAEGLAVRQAVRGTSRRAPSGCPPTRSGAIHVASRSRPAISSPRTAGCAPISAATGSGCVEGWPTPRPGGRASGDPAAAACGRTP